MSGENTFPILSALAGLKRPNNNEQNHNDKNDRQGGNIGDLFSGILNQAVSNIAQNSGLNIGFTPAVTSFTGSRPGSPPPPQPQQNFNFPGKLSFYQLVLSQFTALKIYASAYWQSIGVLPVKVL